MKKPAESYLKRKSEVEYLNVRIDAKVKQQADQAAKKLHTSLNRLHEAALHWYMDALKREGSL